MKLSVAYQRILPKVLCFYYVFKNYAFCSVLGTRALMGAGDHCTGARKF
jgi:hypothetical protein